MNSNVENLNPQVMRYLGKELTKLHKEPLEGIRLCLIDKDLSSVEAVLDGPADTPYANGQFRVKLRIGKEFPKTPPKAFFITKIFHPNVSKDGEICVNTLKKDWTSDLGIKHILLTIKCLLIVPNPESALNEEAGKLLLERYDDYCARAKLYTEIHARPSSSSSSSSSAHASSSGSSSSGATASTEEDVVPKKVSKKEKSIKEKKKTLKRL